MQSDFDCLVIGAGAAGLAAAEFLQSAGADFAVLEAGKEIGGRAKSTVLSDGAVFERGAMVLHGLRVATWEAVIRHGLTTHGSYHHEWFTGHSVIDNEWFVEPTATPRRCPTIAAGEWNSWKPPHSPGQHLPSAANELS